MRHALDLGRPARHVADGSDGRGNVHGARDGSGLAVVQRFRLGQGLGMGFHEIGQAQHQAFALGGAHAAPGAFVQRAVGGAHGAVHIGGAGAGDLGDHGLGSGVDRGQALTALGRNPLAVDEEVVGAPVEESAGALADLVLDVAEVHGSLLGG